jgi:hypothetical protein
MKFRNVKIEDLAKEIYQIEMGALALVQEIEPSAYILQHIGEFLIKVEKREAKAEYT